MDGQERKVAISEAVILDFSGLFGDDPGEKPAPGENRPATSPGERLLEQGEGNHPAGDKMPVKAVKTAQEPQQANKLYFEAQKEREILERSLEICRAYQENTKRSEQLQTDILKGIQAGEGFYSLFLKAVKTISIMTSNPVFYTQAEADTRTIHGKALGQPEPIREQIEETRRRLHRVQEALEREDDPGSREQLRRSVAAHKARIAELEQTIKQ